MLKVYFADVSALEITEKMKSFFCDTRLKKLQMATDKRVCAGAEALLWYALGEEPRYDYGKNGKPYFTDRDMCFNLSHSGSYVACALSKDPVGVDIQQVRAYKDKTARRIFTEAEYEQLQKSENKEKAFCLIWAEKEAYVKRSGGGVGELLNGNIEAVAFSKELNGYALAVCGKGEPEFIEVTVFELTEFFEGMK